MEFLKPILGDELYLAVAQKLADRTDIKIANLAQGGYVAKEKFMAAMEKVAALEAELKNAQQNTASAKEAQNAIALLQATVQKLQQEKELIGRQFEQKLLQEKIETAIMAALTKAKAKNMKAVRALIDESRIVLKDGALTGLTEQIESIKSSDPYMFEISRDTGGGTNPPKSAAQTLSVSPDRLDDKTFYNIKFKK